MNKQELIDALAKETELTKKNCGEILDAITKIVPAELKKGNKVQLIGFGTFEVRTRKARNGVNPKTGTSIKIKASKAPVFKAGKALKDAVNAK